MKRRDFIKLSASTALTTSFMNDSTVAKEPTGVEPEIYLQLVKANDLQISALLKRQQGDRKHRWFGGIKDSHGIYKPGSAADFIMYLTCAYSAPQSRYHHSSKLLKSMERVAGYLLNVQYSDGTVDLPSTNFHSTPDTAFVLEPLCAAYTVLNRSDDNELAPLKQDLKTFIVKAGEAMTIGGVHTPNHRWVICRALARINSLFPDPKYIERIDRWLAENIDMDPDGQYSEKSVGSYSIICNHSFITMARLLDRPELYEPARRNLDMTMYYVHPDGEAVTTASHRWDSDIVTTIAPYYYSYRYMAIHDNNKQFAAMTRFIENLDHLKIMQSSHGRSYLGNRFYRTLVYFLEQPLLRRQLPAGGAVPSDYAKYFSHSELVRIRRENVSATILAENPVFFSFHKGSATLVGLRIASAFFGKGQFKADELKIEEGTYVLTQHLKQGYYQPIDSEHIREDGDWYKMDHGSREQTNIQHLRYAVKITESNGRFMIEINVENPDAVPLTLELGFRHGGELEGVTSLKDVKDGYLLKKGFGKYRYQGDTIRFGPGHVAHQWTQLRGALPKLDAQSVYLTGFGPFNLTLTVS